jgi:predicted transcriptional regulator
MDEEQNDTISKNSDVQNNTNSQENKISSVDQDMKIEEDEKLSTLKTAITKFLNEHTIYEAIPEDMKILVFNDELLIKDSIEAMIKEDIYCGLLYNSKENKNSGIFTIRDVLGLLLIGYKKLILFLNTEKEITSYEMLKENSNKFFGTFDNVNEEKKNMFNSNEDLIVSKQLEGKEENNATNNNNDMEIEDEKNANENNDNNNMNKNIQEKEVKDEETKAYNNIIKDFNHFISLFENITLQSFIDLFHIKDNVNLISLFSEANLEECVKTIQNNNIHRLIVNDKKTNNLSGFITYETIFEFFIENYYSEMTEFNIPLNQINIVINNVITLNKNETLYKCMETFYKAGISMLPILDDDNKIFGYFYLKDIIYFFSMGEKFNFNNTVENFLKDLYEDIDDELPYGKRRIKELNDDTNLKKVFEEMSTSPERKLIIKNDDSKIGIIALYDIFKKLVI